MKSYAFVMLCNNVKFFQTFAKYFPKEGYDDFDFILVFDPRLQDLTCELNEVCMDSTNKYIQSFRVINGNDILFAYSESLPYAIYDKKSLKCLDVLYFLKRYDKVFFVDDDVIMFEPINDWMEHDITVHPWIWDTVLSAKNQKLYHTMFPDYDFTKFIGHHASVGQYVISSKYRDEYYEILLKFYNSELVKKLFVENENRFHKFRWLVDDVLTNMLFMEHLDEIYYTPMADMILCGTTEKILFRKKKTKLRMYHYFEKNKEIVRASLDKMLEEHYENQNH